MDERKLLMNEIKRSELKLSISKQNYNQLFNILIISFIILFVNVGLLFSNPFKWINGIAIGALFVSIAYTIVNLLSEYNDLKFYKERLNKAKWNDHDEIERLNSLTKYHNQFFTMDKKK